MTIQILDFRYFGNPEEKDFEKWRIRYDGFAQEVVHKIQESGKSIHIILSNMGSLRAALGKIYGVRKYNNGMKYSESMEVLYERVRIEDIRVVVIDAVNGLIEISEVLN